MTRTSEVGNHMRVIITRSQKLHLTLWYGSLIAWFTSMLRLLVRMGRNGGPILVTCKAVSMLAVFLGVFKLSTVQLAAGEMVPTLKLDHEAWRPFRRTPRSRR